MILEFIGGPADGLVVDKAPEGVREVYVHDIESTNYHVSSDKAAHYVSGVERVEGWDPEVLVLMWSPHSTGHP